MIIVETEFRFDTLSMNSDGLAVEDEELLRLGVVCLASDDFSKATVIFVPCRIASDVCNDIGSRQGKNAYGKIVDKMCSDF